MAIGTKLGRLALRNWVRPSRDFKPGLTIREMPTFNYTEAGGLIFPRNFRSGLITSNDTDAVHDINIAVGQCRDSTDTKNMLLETTITKRIDATWGEGDDAGGLASGVSLAADTTYHLYLIKDTGAITGVTDAGGGDITLAAASHLLTSNSRVTISGSLDYDGSYAVTAVSAGVSFNVTATFVKRPFVQTGTYESVDAGFDTSATAANLLTDSGYTYYRRVASVTTDEQVGAAANILEYVQYGNQFIYKSPGAELLLITNDAIASASNRVTVSPDHIPTGFKVIARCNFHLSDTSATGCYVTPLTIVDDELPSDTVAPLSTMFTLSGGRMGTTVDVLTNTSGQFGIRVSTNTDIVDIATIGWYDFLGDND